MSTYVITWSDMNPSDNQNKALMCLIFYFLHQTSYDILMVMLVVANFANKNDAKKPKKWLQPWLMGTHMRALQKRELSNEY